MTPAVAAPVRDAYDASAVAWSDGPERVFAAMAEALVACAPIPLSGLTAVDLGTGSGVVAGALLRAGARVGIVDDSISMLTIARARTGCGAVLSDVRALALRAGCVDVACAGFVLNHLDRPAAALRAIARVVRPGGAVLASTWARGEEHPVKQAVEEALLRRGWTRPGWYARLKDTTTPLTDTAAALHACATEAGLVDVTARLVQVDLDDLPLDAMIAWRLNLPASATFVAAMTQRERLQLVEQVGSALGPDRAPLRLQMIALSSRVAA